eukprot:Unigene770_Nuclearia_a/m.2492 Unigene770_Nuclearia_a/g.2492  ORF Unigene770_Nuclearia_a/g.2492 Unigene770_Nuclearia_a/m.2492 type:complete len:400 (+) Unigene770_Nuclearia_a:3432-4631(+)
MLPMIPSARWRSAWIASCSSDNERSFSVARNSAQSASLSSRRCSEPSLALSRSRCLLAPRWSDNSSAWSAVWKRSSWCTGDSTMAWDCTGASVGVLKGVTVRLIEVGASVMRVGRLTSWPSTKCASSSSDTLGRRTARSRPRASVFFFWCCLRAVGGVDAVPAARVGLRMEPSLLRERDMGGGGLSSWDRSSECVKVSSVPVRRPISAPEKLTLVGLARDDDVGVRELLRDGLRPGTLNAGGDVPNGKAEWSMSSAPLLLPLPASPASPWTWACGWRPLLVLTAMRSSLKVLSPFTLSSPSSSSLWFSSSLWSSSSSSFSSSFSSPSWAASATSSSVTGGSLLTYSPSRLNVYGSTGRANWRHVSRKSTETSGLPWSTHSARRARSGPARRTASRVLTT